MKPVIPSISELAVALATSALVACQPQRARYADVIASARPDESIEVVERELADSSNKDRLVFLLESGLLHLRQADLERSQERFDEAASRIGLVWGEGQERALTWFGEESDKEFKGEPFEQSLCCFYDGWTRLARGDLDGAATCFKAAQLLDRTAGDRSDFALAVFFEALVRTRLGEAEEAEDLLRWFAVIEPSAAPLIEHLRANDFDAVVLVVTGDAPRKVAVGKHFATLAYEQEWSDVASVTIETGDHREPAPCLCWTYAQATEGGRRVVDHLNVVESDNRTEFEEHGIDAARGAVDVARQLDDIPRGVDTGVAKDVQGAYAIAAGAFLVASMSGASAADIRAWTTLPERMFVALVRVPADVSEIAVEPFDADGRPLPVVRHAWNAPARSADLRCVYLTLDHANP